jgi:hypothetical protein
MICGESIDTAELTRQFKVGGVPQTVIIIGIGKNKFYANQYVSWQ